MLPLLLFSGLNFTTLILLDLQRNNLQSTTVTDSTGSFNTTNGSFLDPTESGSRFFDEESLCPTDSDVFIPTKPIVNNHGRFLEGLKPCPCSSAWMIGASQWDIDGYFGPWKPGRLKKVDDEYLLRFRNLKKMAIP